MKKSEALKIYKETREKLNAYSLILATVYYDRLTIAPKKGAKKRNEALAFMDGEYFTFVTDPKYVEAVVTLSRLDLKDPLKREIYLEKKSLEDILKFTKEEQMAFSLAQMDSNDAWQKAKQNNAYPLFEPHLKKMFAMSMERAKKRDPKKDPYDLYLDDFEEGMTKKDYEKFFSVIRRDLVPLIREVAAKDGYIDDSFLYKYYPEKKQEEFLKILCDYLGFDPSWGYMGVSEHPFTNDFSRNDIRITTNYDEHYIAGAIFSVIHEVGHATYGHQIDPKYEGTAIANGISSGMHESQSRFFENYLGRRKSFWKTLYPKLQQIFPENLGDVSLDDFVKAINVSRPSLIRTDADELTYPMHILVRYEIEKGVFDGSISTDGLNETWKKMYKEYLGVDVPDDTNGILQDTHWSDASFGYFPTYALGSAIGAQILAKMEKDIDVDRLLEEGKFAQIKKYLKDSFQKYGALYDYRTILKMYTGKDFDPKYFVRYLTKKYKTLYGIK